MRKSLKHAYLKRHSNEGVNFWVEANAFYQSEQRIGPLRSCVVLIFAREYWSFLNRLGGECAVFEVFRPCSGQTWVLRPAAIRCTNSYSVSSGGDCPASHLCPPPYRPFHLYHTSIFRPKSLLKYFANIIWFFRPKITCRRDSHWCSKYFLSMGKI